MGALATMALAPALAGAATIEVTTTDDELSSDGDCSLREAVQSANGNTSVDECSKGQGAKRDTIELAAETYVLTVPSTNEGLNANGDLDYTGGGALTIAGVNRDETYLVAGAGDRVIEAAGDASALRLERLGVDSENVSALVGELEDVGGGVKVRAGSLTLKGIDVLDGTAHSGGGVYFSKNAPLRITGTFFLDNEAANGGGLYARGSAAGSIRRSGFAYNKALTMGVGGGGLLTSMDSMRMSDTVIFDNDLVNSGGGGAAGAGVYAPAGGLVVRRSVISLNEATGIAGGGGIAAFGADAPNKIVNSTFYDNSAADDAGGFYGAGKLSHVTFLANTAEEEGDHIRSTDELTLRNSILPGADGFVDLCSTSDPGEIVSKGFSVSTYDDPGCGFLDSDVFGAVDFVPGGPTDNGGPTETIAIEGSSLAKDLVPNGKCKVAGGEDQRGFERPKGPRCDAGAFERGAQP